MDDHIIVESVVEASSSSSSSSFSSNSDTLVHDVHVSQGFFFPPEVYNHDYRHPLAYIFTHARAVQPWGLHFLGAAILLVLISGRIVKGKADSTDKLISLILSFLWSGHALMMMQDSCANFECHITFWSLAMLYAWQSLVFLIGGFILNRFRFQRMNFLAISKSKVLGFSLLAYSLFSCIGHYSTKGGFFLLSFPLDAFTLGFLLSCGYYLNIVAYALPVVYCLGRSANTVAHFGFSGEWSLLLLSSLSLLWLGHRYFFPPPKPERSRGGRGHHRQQQQQQQQQQQRPQAEPLLQEVIFSNSAKAEKFKGQGLMAVNQMMVTDQDGDEAHEFWEATDDGGFKTRSN